MTQERFEYFIKEYLKEYDKDLPVTMVTAPIKPFLATKDNAHILGFYYKEAKQDNYLITTTTPTNAFEECIEAIAKEEGDGPNNINKFTFSFVRYEGLDLESFYGRKKVLQSYVLTIVIPKADKNGKINIADFAKSEKFANNKILLKGEILYSDMQECSEQFKMVKMIVNALQQKWKTKDSISTLKEVCKSLNLSEQTMFSWKKKNPQVFKAMLDGYFFSKVENILEFLVEVPNIQKNTWNCDKTTSLIDDEVEG